MLCLARTVHEPITTTTRNTNDLDRFAGHDANLCCWWAAITVASVRYTVRASTTEYAMTRRNA